MRALLTACGLLAVLPALYAQSPSRAPSLDEVLGRMSAYVAAYGAQASVFVGREAYVQSAGRYQPRRLTSEFAIVKAGGGDIWTGYRDVVEVDGTPLVDRRDRLLGLLSAAIVDVGQLRRIDDESARYNIGPISRNFNVPTTALFFFDPRTIKRFAFEPKGTREIDGVSTWELEFKETARPTLVRTRSGRDVPCFGRLWVVPADGTIVRTLLELRNFADERLTPRPAAPSTQTPGTPPPSSTRSLVGGSQVTTSAPAPIANNEAAPREPQRLESRAIIDVTYRLEGRFGTWLPSSMSETYQGAIRMLGYEPFLGRAECTARYSDFKRFETSVKIVIK